MKNKRTVKAKRTSVPKPQMNKAKRWFDHLVIKNLILVWNRGKKAWHGEFLRLDRRIWKKITTGVWENNSRLYYRVLLLLHKTNFTKDMGIKRKELKPLPLNKISFIHQHQTWRDIPQKAYILFRIVLDSIQLVIYPIFKRQILRAANVTQTFYRGMAEKPEHAWLKPVAGAHLATVKASSGIIFYIILLLFIIFLIWANFFEIDEYVHAQGKIEPESEVKTLSHFEGGVIQDILVKEGDKVKEDQVLIKLKGISSKATYEESLRNYYFYWAQILRLKAQIDQKPLIFPQEIQSFSPAIVKETTERYHTRMGSYHNEEEILTDQLDGNKSELKELIKKIESLKILLKLSTERTELLAMLVDKKLIAKTQFIQSKIDTANRTMELETAKSNISKLKARVQEGQNKLEQVKFRYNSQDWQELKDLELRFQEDKKMITSGKDQVERMEVRSPVNGIVKDLFVHTIGAAATAGKELITVVPIKDSLLVEARVLPQDIGFIHAGEPVNVKVSAFDYSIYGGLEGTVEKVGPDAIQDPKDPERTYYRVHIRTDKNAIDHRGKSYVLKAGETVQADIITAQRTIMQYILKPLRKSLSDPLRER